MKEGYGTNVLKEGHLAVTSYAGIYYIVQRKGYVEHIKLIKKSRGASECFVLFIGQGGEVLLVNERFG